METGQNIVAAIPGILILLYVWGYTALRAHEVISQLRENGEEGEAEAVDLDSPDVTPGRGTFDHAQQRRRDGKADAPLWGVAATVNAARKAIVDRIRDRRRADDEEESDGRRERGDQEDRRGRDQEDQEDSRNRGEDQDRGGRDDQGDQERDGRGGSDDPDPDRHDDRRPADDEPDPERRRWQDRRGKEQPKPEPGTEQPHRSRWKDWRDQWKTRRGEESDKEYWDRRRREGGPNHTAEQNPRYVPHSPQIDRPIHALTPPPSGEPNQQPRSGEAYDVEIIDGTISSERTDIDMAGGTLVPGSATGGSLVGGDHGGLAPSLGGGGSHDDDKELARKIKKAMQLTQNPIDEALAKAKATLSACWAHVDNLSAEGIGGEAMERWGDTIIEYETVVSTLESAKKKSEQATNSAESARRYQATHGNDVQRAIEKDRASTARRTRYY